MDHQFWITTIVSLVGLWIMWKTGPGMTRDAAVPGTPARRYWPIAVMALLLLGAWAPFLISRYSEPDTTAETESDWTNYKPTLIRERTYENQTVALDGYHYQDCHFINVTFEYNGTTPVMITYNKIQGSMVLTSKDRSIYAAIRLVVRMAEQAQAQGIRVQLKDETR